MNSPSFERPLAQIDSCRDLPNKRPKVDLSEGIEFQPGYILDGRFVIGEALSRGGMATIYEAEDVKDRSRKLAIKIPFARFERDPAYVARFLREESIGLQMDHPALLKFVPVKGDKSRLYLVTEFLSGCTLSSLIFKRAPLPERDAQRIASLVCDALRYLHGRGFIHRDLKPDNIMLCADQTIRIMDFGLAAPITGRLDILADKTPIFGTPQYMAPEQVKRTPLRRPHRHLQPRRRPLRDAHGEAALCPRRSLGHCAISGCRRPRGPART